MDWLNYHHLHYFWVVPGGSVIRALELLHLSRPTISGRIPPCRRGRRGGAL